jgi:hypothetical protein
VRINLLYLSISLLLCTGKSREVRLFLGKSRVGIGHSVYTRSENALSGEGCGLRRLRKKCPFEAKPSLS